MRLDAERCTAPADLFRNYHRTTCVVKRIISIAPIRRRNRRCLGLARSSGRQDNGSAFSPLSHVKRLLRQSLAIASRFELGRILRFEESLCPPLAIGAPVASTLCHREHGMEGTAGLATHDDRIDVASSGPLHFGLAPAALSGMPKSRL